MLCERRPAIQPEADTAVLVVDVVERPRAHRQEVRAERLRLREHAANPPVCCFVSIELLRSRHDFPRGRSEHRNPVGGLEIRLIEAREDPVGRVRLELGVDVLAAVDRVDEVVDPLAGLVVEPLVHDPDLIALTEHACREREARPVATSVDLAAVHLEPGDLAAGELDEEVATGMGERDRGVALERLRPCLEFEVDDVRDVRHLRRSIDGFLTRQPVAHARHGHSSLIRASLCTTDEVGSDVPSARTLRRCLSPR